MSIQLLASTGDPHADTILRGIVGLIELTFPGRIRGYYLSGSYGDGSATRDSDIDLAALFRDQLEPTEREQFQGVFA